MSLKTIPKEIIVYHLLPLLPPEAVLEVLIALRLEVTKEIYDNAFHDNVQHDHYDLEMFRERLYATLYVFGDANKFFSESASPSCVEAGTEYWFDYRRIYQPCRVMSTGHISYVAPGPSLHIINSKGELCYSRRDSETQIEVNRAQTSQSPIFVEVASDKNGTFAVDNMGLIWKWSDIHSTKGIVVHSEFAGQAVSMLRVCPEEHACYVEGTGIVRWSKDDPQGHIVPFTTDIRDFIVLSGKLVYIRQDGTFSDTDADGDYPKAMKDACDRVNMHGPFTRIMSTGEVYTLITDDGRIFEGSWTQFRYGREPVVEEYKHNVRDLAAISQGYAHLLALTKSGEMYASGMELKLDGSLGMGRLKDILKMKPPIKEASHLRLNDFTKVNLPGRVYGVYAGNGYSAVLMYDGHIR